MCGSTDVTGTFEQCLENGHVQIPMFFLTDAEHSQQVRHPDNILNLATRNSLSISSILSKQR